MIKNFDNMGRIVIPKEMRNAIKISKNGSVRIEQVKDMIILTNYENNEIENKLVENKIDFLKKMINQEKL